MNFTYVLGFVVLWDVVKVFLVSSSSFARKTVGRNRAWSHSGAWRGLKTKWDLKLSLPSPTYLTRYLFMYVGSTTPKLTLEAFQLWQHRSLNFQSFSDPSGIRWRVRGAKEAPIPRDSLNYRRSSLLSRNEFESGTFTIVLHATSSFTYVSVIYGANFSFKSRVACKAAPPLFFLSFWSVSLLLFFFFFLFTMLLALSVFLLTRTNVELKQL